MRSLIEPIAKSGYQLRQADMNTMGNPRKLGMEQFEITNPSIKRKQINYSITTLSDLMILKETGNSWNQQLLNQF